MALFQRRRHSLTGSAFQVNAAKSDYMKRLAEPWQNRALDYYDQVGEIRFASQFYARMLSRVRFFPATLKDDGSTDVIESGPPVDHLNRIQDAGGGRSRIQYDYGRLMFVTGEGVLFGSGLGPDGSAPGTWRFLWRDEVEFTDSGIAIRKDAQGKKTAEFGTGYRMWTPHPKHSDQADSPLRAVLDIAEELMILTASVRGTAVTRLTKGIFAIPSEVSPNSIVEPGQEDDPEANAFLRALTEHLQNQIENPSSAASKVPFVMEGAYEYLDRIKWIQLHDPQSDYLERDLRIEGIKRLALGLDLPPEALLGMTDANHWTAQQVQFDMWRAHGAPIAEQFGDDLAAAYLRPALIAEGYADAEKVVVAYDDSMVVISPDRTTNADEAADRGMISFEGYRKLKGIDEQYAPSPEEQDFWIAMHTRNLQPIGITPPPPTFPAGNPPGPPTPPAKGSNGQGPPEPPSQGRVVSRQEARTAAILGAASLALRQCRARAGARLRTAAARKSSGCDECDEKAKGIPDSIVASALGPELLEELGRRDPLALVKGGTDDFRDILAEWGIFPAGAELLCQRVETYAASTLFEPEQPELPPGFATLVDQAQEASDALPA